MQVNMYTPSLGKTYRVFLLTKEGKMVMKDLSSESDRRVFESMSTFTPALSVGHVAIGAKAMAIFDVYGKLVFGSLEPSVEKTFASWMQLS